MTPMIDIVFLLIIFFMTVSQVSKVNKERLELPQQPGEEAQKESVIIININEKGQYIIASRDYTLNNMVSHVSRELSKKNGNTSLVKVLFRVDRRGISEPVNRAVTALSKMGVNQVRFGVEHTEG